METEGGEGAYGTRLEGPFSFFGLQCSTPRREHPQSVPKEGCVECQQAGASLTQFHFTHIFIELLPCVCTGVMANLVKMLAGWR